MAQAETTNGKPLSDEEIAAFLDTRIRGAVGFADSTLARQRARAASYYDAKEPKPFHRGNSKYVSQDVFEAVEAMKGQLLETFSGNRLPVRFTPTGKEDVEPARIATEYTNFVVFQQNPGWFVFQDIIHDGLMNRVGIAQVYWRKDLREVEEVHEGVANDQAVALIVSAEAGIKEWDSKPNKDGTIDLTVTRTVDRSQVVIEAVPPEEFGISPRAKDIKSAEIVYRSCYRTQDELIREGYDKKVIQEIWQDDKLWLETSPEKLERFEDTDDMAFIGLDSELQAARKSVLVYNVFTELDVSGSGTSELYRIVYAGNRVLEKERVSCKNFVAFTPLRRPHSFWGTPYAERVMKTQDVKTVLTRAIVDHTVLTTNPRYIVRKGALANPKELLESRIGGVVTVNNSMDGVQPLQQAPLNPFVFQTRQILGEDRESITGVSQLSQGLNKDAISKQNSADMVQQLSAMSQTRQKVIARNFAEGFLTDLWLLVYQLVCENESGAKVAEIAGNWVQVDPENWIERKDVSVEFALGYGEQDKELAKYQQLDQYLSQTAGPAYGPQQRFNVITKALNAMGIKDVENYFLPPQQVQPPPPPPELVLAQREMALKERQQQFEEVKWQQEHGRKSTETQLKFLRESGKEDLAEREFGLKLAEHEHAMTVDVAEIELQRQAQKIMAIPKPVAREP